MKQNGLLKKVLFMALPFVMLSIASQAQCSKKQSAECQRKYSEMKAKYEANGLQWNEAEMKKNCTAKNTQSASARQCVKDKNAAVAPNKVSKALLAKLPKERQEYVKSHPEKYTIID